MRKTILFFIGLLFISNAVQARKVTGYVRGEGKPLSGVVVTDGRNFTTTSSRGKFKFNISDSARFVSVVTPSGYVADFSSGAPKFYQEAAGVDKFEFNLSKTSDSRDFTLFSVSDPQLANDGHLKKFSGKPLEDLKAQSRLAAEDSPAAGILLGDIAWDAMDMIPKFKSAMSAVSIPFYAVIGNHDFDRALKGKEAAKGFCDSYGPYNFAFHIGGALVIGLKNIDYDTDKKYMEAYTDEEIDFVRSLLKYIPVDEQIFVAQHSPVKVWWENRYVGRGEELLSLFEGRKVEFLSGHTHVQNNIPVAGNIIDHNAPSICGAWWKTNWCRDGSPRGYEIFRGRGGKLDWVLHPIDYDEDFQVNIIPTGQSKAHPNAVVANIWDYDPQWSVNWYQDGKPMGKMEAVLDVDPNYQREILKAYGDKKIPGFRVPKKNIHYFAAVPSQYAKKVTVEVVSRFGRKWTYDVVLSEHLDVQAHRGGAGLVPENTITAMRDAIDRGVNTLELDLQISKDGKVVVSHDSWFHARYAQRPDGTAVGSKDPKEYLYTMPYDSIAKYDVGIRPSTVWPEKKNVSERKPLAGELIDFVEKYVADNGLTPMRYNIEVKSREGAGEGVNWPEYKEFSDRCIELLLSKNLGDRLVVQCFDERALNYMHEKYPQVAYSYLTDKETDYDALMGKLNFVPVWWSPNYKAVNEALVKRAHADGIRVVPWTCDNPEEMKKIIEMGVDALITNYPDRLLNITRGY